VFELKTPAAVARSLKKSAEPVTGAKSAPFQSAMSMLNFEIIGAARILLKRGFTSWNRPNKSCEPIRSSAKVADREAVNEVKLTIPRSASR